MAAGGLLAFVAVSLAASWLLVSRLERLAERVGLSEAWLGLVAALAADAPEITSAVYLAMRGRGAAVLSIALNSNAINVVAGLLIPASITGLGPPSGQNLLVASWYARRVYRQRGGARRCVRQHRSPSRRTGQPRPIYFCARAIISSVTD